MRIKTELEQEVEKTLNSLEGMHSASPGPFFFTRVQARLYKSELNIWERISAFIARPVIAMAVILSIVLMNSVVFLQQEQTASLAEQSDQHGYEEFSLADNASYDFENQEP